jgi:type II secretory ATPase GspE/PulE/Tfp pilus assembly ATPase PilB-like protein
VVRFVSLLIREAADTGASDIHLDATRDGLRIRLRFDDLVTGREGCANFRTWRAPTRCRSSWLRPAA